MKTTNKKKIVVSGIATIFLIALYCLIFSFSEQDGETSGSLSRMISEKCVELLNMLSGRHWTELMMEGMAEYFENPIRKLAHFCEYAVMGILVFFVWYPWIGMGEKVIEEFGKTRWLSFVKRHGIKIIVVLWVFISAAFDELHQTFIPGRDGNFWDVLLDTAGGSFGVVLCLLALKLIQRRQRKRCF